MRTGQSRWDDGQSRRGGSAAPATFAASKVPLITAYFWIVKLLSTAMGEATSDYMVRTINPVTAVLLGFTGFVIAMVIQLRAKAYNAWIYWLAVVMVAVFGTQAADVLHIKFHVPYVASTTFYAIVLAVIFILWYRTEGTLSIHSIRTPRRELFYWATVLATFALGTATGDMTARTLNLGYLASGIWFSLAFAAVAVAHWKFHMNPILAFWIAYVLTRPVGASFADYVAFPHSVGGLGVGHGPVALALTVVIVILVAYLAVTRKDVEGPRQAAAAAPPRYAAASGSMPPHAARPDPPVRYSGQYRDGRYPGEPYQGQRGPGQPYPEERHAGQQYQGQSYPGRPYSEEQYRGQRHPGQPYPGDHPARSYAEEQYSGEQYQTQQYPSERYQEERYPGQRYREERYPGRYPEERYPGEQPQQYPEDQYPEERYRGEQYRGQRYRGDQYPEERYPGQPHPAPPRSGPPSRSGPPRQPREPWPPNERRPSRQPRQAPEGWRDEDEAEQTAWGFFMWDE